MGTVGGDQGAVGRQSTGPDFGVRSALPSVREGRLLDGIKAAVLTVSDSVARGEREDLSGPRARNLLADLGADLTGHGSVTRDKARIAYSIERISGHGVRLILLIGGTGLEPRDVTPEAVMDACDRIVPGFGEVIRAEGARHSRRSWLSRSVAGIKRGTLVIALPGDPDAFRDCLAAVADLIPEALLETGGKPDRA